MTASFKDSPSAKVFKSIVISVIAEATACSPNYRIAWVQIYVEIFSRFLQILQKKFRLKHNENNI